MFKRDMEPELLLMSKHYPIVTVTGPRQSGKTTLVKQTFPDMPYVNLENPDIRTLAIEDSRGFLAQYPEGAILDEIQRAPILLSYIQVIVDEKDCKGMFILTGSNQLELSQTITQSLAGRTSILNLLPMSINELTKSGMNFSLDQYLLSGFFPQIYKDSLNPTKAYRNYFQTYVERDLRQLVNVKNLSQFQKFVYLCAGRIGQVINMESLGNDVGASSNTIKQWLSILEASFILIRLQPYYENFGKRIIKSPKIYFTDVGLACYLLGLENEMQVSRDPLRGNLFENLVFLELAKYRFNKGLDHQLYFYRDKTGNEVDFLYKKGHDLVPIEVKAAKSFNSSFLRNLKYFQNIAKERVQNGFLIYGGEQEQNIKGFSLLSFIHSFHALE